MSLNFSRLEQLDERTNYIVFGYIRNIKRRLLKYSAYKDTPKLIQCMCLLYVDDSFMLDNGRYTWDIKDRILLNRMLEANVGDKYESNRFEIGKLKWTLYAYPNGYNSIHRGSFKLYLKLLSTVPNEWSNIVVCIRTHCPEINLLYTSIKTIKKDSRIPLWSNATLLLKDIIHLNPERLTFEINVKILRILLNKNNKIFYQFSVAKKIYRKKQHFYWTLDKDLIQSIKKGCRMGSSYESKIFNDMWCITCCPNSNKGNVILCLQLICLPSNIAKFKVKYTLKCHEANVQSTNIKIFEYEQGKSYGLWTASKMLSFEEFKSFDSISLSANITILEEIQCNSYGDTQDEIEHYWTSYIKQKEYFEEISHSYYDHKYYSLEQKLNGISHQISQICDNIQTLSANVSRINKMNGYCRNCSDLHNNKVWLWLKKCVGLEMYFDLFVENGLDDLDIVSALRSDDLVTVGIEKLGHRMKIMKCIADLRKNNGNHVV